MRILVIGGGGFLGSAFVTELAKIKGTEVHVFDLFKYGFPEKLPRKKNIKNPITGNIRDYYSVARAIDSTRPDVVVHLVAHITRPEFSGESRTCAEINYLGTANILEACVNTPSPPRKIVFASCEAARNPQANFGISKRAAEQLIETLGRDSGMQVAILRFAEIYGYNKRSHTSQGMINFLIDHMIGGNGIGVFSVDKVKDHVHLSDAVRALVVATTDVETAFCKIDIGPGVAISIKDLVNKLRDLTGYEGSLEFLEHPSAHVVDSVSDTGAARALWGFECIADMDTELAILVKKRRKDLK